MTRINPHSHFSSFPGSQGQDTALSANGGTQGTQRSTAAGQSAPAGVVALKRAQGAADFLASASKRARIEITVPGTTGDVQTGGVKSAIEKEMGKKFKEVCASLVKDICQKMPVANDGEAAGREETVKKLVAQWVTLAKNDPCINVRRLRPQRLLILTNMLAKIVRSEGTYEDACKWLWIEQSPLASLTAKATADYSALQEKDSTLPELSSSLSDLNRCAFAQSMHCTEIRQKAAVFGGF